MRKFYAWFIHGPRVKKLRIVRSIYSFVKMTSAAGQLISNATAAVAAGVQIGKSKQC